MQQDNMAQNGIKKIAFAKITEPSEVQSALSNANEIADDGAIFVQILEEGNTDLIYCRYAMGEPYYKVEVGEKVWVEPTVRDSERWVYTGIVDVGNGIPTESFVLGDTAKAELQKGVDALSQLQTDFTSWAPVPNDGGASLKALLASGFLTKPLPDLTNILSDLIKGK